MSGKFELRVPADVDGSGSNYKIYWDTTLR